MLHYTSTLNNSLLPVLKSCQEVQTLRAISLLHCNSIFEHVFHERDLATELSRPYKGKAERQPAAKSSRTSIKMPPIHKLSETWNKQTEQTMHPTICVTDNEVCIQRNRHHNHPHLLSLSHDVSHCWRRRTFTKERASATFKRSQTISCSIPTILHPSNLVKNALTSNKKHTRAINASSVRETAKAKKLAERLKTQSRHGT